MQDVPWHLKKGNPSFHLIMPYPDDKAFCRSSFTSMILNYPPPTAVNFRKAYDKEQTRENAKLTKTYAFLKSSKIQDEDLVLIVDGDTVWFQLPADVMIKQYELLVHAANQRLHQQYGNGANGKPLFNQTIVWGARKQCSKDQKHDPACAAVPEGPLPPKIYGAQTDQDAEGLLHRAMYLNPRAVIGPAKDVRDMYEAAIERMKEAQRNKGADLVTTQYVFSALFGEQEFARSRQVSSQPKQSWHDWLTSKLGHEEHDHPSHVANLTVSDKRYEFSMGLDYTSMLFQSVVPAAPKELQFVTYSQTSLLNQATLPAFPKALAQSRGPFANLTNPVVASPNPQHLEYITELGHDSELDELRPANTSWTDVPLLTNSIVKSLPCAIISSTTRGTTKQIDTRSTPPSALQDRASHLKPSLIWSKLWFHNYARALLRNYLRYIPQGITSFHNSAVGGDLRWDERGGEGGIWDNEGRWYEWGYEVCEGEEEEVFGDGKGKFLREHEPDSDGDRRRRRTIRRAESVSESVGESSMGMYDYYDARFVRMA
jgi:hypothetical protein